MSKIEGFNVKQVVELVGLEKTDATAYRPFRMELPFYDIVPMGYECIGWKNERGCFFHRMCKVTIN